MGGLPKGQPIFQNIILLFRSRRSNHGLGIFRVREGREGRELDRREGRKGKRGSRERKERKVKKI